MVRVAVRLLLLAVRLAGLVEGLVAGLVAGLVRLEGFAGLARGLVVRVAVFLARGLQAFCKARGGAQARDM